MGYYTKKHNHYCGMRFACQDDVCVHYECRWRCFISQKYEGVKGNIFKENSAVPRGFMYFSRMHAVVVLAG